MRSAPINGDSLFFQFSGKYPTKPDKVTKLNGKVLFLEGSDLTQSGPAYRQILGLPEGDAGRVTETSSGGTTSFPIGADIVDCATEPPPGSPM
jgi:hypothetical protein